MTAKKKVALLFICLNPNYWPYVKNVIQDCKKYFLTNHESNHELDFFLWTDMGDYEVEHKKTIKSLNALSLKVFSQPLAVALQQVCDQILPLIGKYDQFDEVKVILERLAKENLVFKRDGGNFWIESTMSVNSKMISTLIQAGKEISEAVLKNVQEVKDSATIIDTEPTPWPAPTLMRYNLFLTQEEKLKEYDYLFYMDADMRVVDFIDDEILSEGLTAALHPMYAVKKQYERPYEPNPESTAFIGGPTHYYAGGFQGGVASDFIKAMTVMRDNVNKDLGKHYTSRWNDESHWNRYLWEHAPSVVLSPAYIYPDSLIEEYYKPLWGQDYKPKIITLTKPFSVSKDGGAALAKMLGLPEPKNGIYEFKCPECGDIAKHTLPIISITKCGGSGKEHQIQCKT